MTNLILKVNNSELNFYEVDTCVISWTVKSLKEWYIYKWVGYKDLTIKISWENNYKLKSEYYPYNPIEWWVSIVWGWNLPYFNKSNLPQIWEKVNYLVISEDFSLISDKYEDWNFILKSGEILEQEISFCKPSWIEIKIEKDIFYIWFIWVWMFLLIILSILLYKRIKALKT